MSQRTGAARLLALTVLIFAPLSFAYNGVASNARPSLKNDFTSYYVAGLAVREGMPEALYYPRPVGSLLAQASQQHPWIDLARPAGIDNPNYYLYPPLFAVLFAPLTLLPYGIAYVCWIGFGAICLAAAVVMILGGNGWLTWRDETLPAAAAVVLVSCLFYPVARTFAVGQSSVFLLALMTGALVALGRRTRGGDMAAGACLAAGIMLKLTPAILLPWLIMRRRWRALGATLAAFAALAAVSVAAVGVGPHRAYLAEMVGLLSGGTAFYPNQSFAGLFARAAGGNMRLADLVDPGSTPALLARVAAIAAIAATFWVMRRRRREDVEFGLLILASLLASPISWEHHYVLALIPAWILVREAARGALSTGRAAAAGVALALIGSYIGLRVIGAFGTGAAAQAVASAGLAGGLLLWAVVAFLREDREAGGGAIGDARGATAALLVLVSVFAAGNFLLKVAEYNRSYSYGDFTSYYVAAATIVEGRGDPLYYPGTPDMILARAETPSAWTATADRWGVRDANYYLYPPFFAIAMIPLVLLPYGAAHGVWYIANLLALGGFLWLWVRARGAEGEGLAGAEKAMPVIAVALSWPTLFTFGAGQANLVVLLLLLGALESLRRGRDIPAGLMAAGAAAIKMTPALLLVYLAWRKRWRALAAAAAGLCALVLAGAAVTGWSSYVVYAREMVPLLSRGCPHHVNQSLAAFFTRLVDGSDMGSWALAQPSPTSRMLTTIAAAGLLAAALAVIGRPGRRDDALDLEFSLIVVTTLFLSPVTWTHHSVLSLLAFLVAARWLIARGRVTLAAAAGFAVAFTMVNIYFKPPGFFERGPLAVLASYNLAGNLVLWGMLALMLWRPRADGPEAAA